MASNYPYPFDNTGTLVSNKLTDEKHVLSFYSNPTKTIIPVNAPFYRNSLRVYHEPTGEYLTEGMDFYLGHIFESAQQDQRYSVYGSISFIDIAMVGNVKVTYQTVGGPYTVPFEEILTYLSKPFERPQSRVWAEVMKYPRDIVPMDPIGSLEEAIERDPITGSLNDIQLKLKEYYNELQTRLDTIHVELERVEGEAVDWGFITHDHENGLAHELTPSQLGAVALRGTSKDALKAFNMSLAQLITYINSININQDKLDEYLPLSGGIMRGRILMRKEKAVIANANGTTVLDLRDGSVRISTKGNLTLKANSNKNADVTTLLRAGLNRLAVDSKSGARNADGLAFNGYMVLHSGNIAQFIPKLQAAKLPIATQVSEYVLLRGAGRGENATPLDGVVTFPKATSTKLGVVVLSDHPATSSDLIVPSSKAITLLKAGIDSKLDDTTTVNGKRLTGDIIITASDLGLNRVNNTHPENKPSSNAFKAEVAKKVNEDHKHDMADFSGWTNAAIDVYGFFRLSSDITSTSLDHAATPDAAFQLENVIETIEAEAGKYIPANALDVTAYGGTSGLPISVGGSFVNNGYPNKTLGKTAVLIEGGYLKFLRNGGSYGELHGAYFSYCTLQGTVMGEIVNTTVKYEPSFLTAGRNVMSVLTSSQDYILAVAGLDDSTDQRLMLIKMNGSMDATLHTGKLLDLPFNTTYAEYSIFVVNGYIYVMHFDEMRFQYFRMYRIKETELISNPNPVMEVISVSTDHIGGRAAKIERPRLYNYNMLAPDIYSFLRVKPGYNYNLYRIQYHTGNTRSMTVIEGKVYLYIAFEGHHSITGEYGVYFHTALTFTYDPIKHELTLVDGWPETVDKIPMHDKNLSYETYGQPDRHVERQEVSYALRTHHRYGQVFRQGVYEVAIGGYGSYQSNIGLDSYKADPLERINAKTRGNSLYVGKGLVVSSGGVVQEKPTTIAVGMLPLKGTGALTMCLMGTSSGRSKYWARVYDENEAKQEVDTGVYVYRDTWEIPYADFVKATSGVINQRTKVQLSVFTDNDTACALTGESLDESAITYDISASAIKPALGAVKIGRQFVMLESKQVNAAKWNAIVAYSYAGWYTKDITNGYRTEYFLYRARVELVGTVQTVRAVELLPGADAPRVVRNTYRDGKWNIHRWLSCVALTGTTELSIALPFERFDSTNGSTMLSLPYGANGVGSLLTYFLSHVNTNDVACGTVYGKYLVRGLSDPSYTSMLADAWPYGTTARLHTGKPIVLTAVKDNWTVYFTADQPYYTANTQFTIAPENFDLRVLFPSNHKSNIFYIYATVIGNKALYVITETLDEDYGVRSYIGYVTTTALGIHELDVRPLLRLGRVQELVDHISNPIAHTGEELGGASIGLGKVQNLELEHEFNPHVYPSELKYVSEAAVLDFKAEMQDRMVIKKGSFPLLSGITHMPRNMTYPDSHKQISVVTKFRAVGVINLFEYKPYVEEGNNWVSRLVSGYGGTITVPPIAKGIWFKDGTD